MTDKQAKGGPEGQGRVKNRATDGRTREGMIEAGREHKSEAAQQAAATRAANRAAGKSR
jgi:hypothetical protein